MRTGGISEERSSKMRSERERVGKKEREDNERYK